MLIFAHKAFFLHRHSIVAGVLMGRFVYELNFNNGKHWFGFDIGRHYQYYSTSSNKWESCHSGANFLDVNFKRWHFGAEHIYYDGPHCSYSFGPFHLHWTDDNCDKCLG